MKYGDTISIRDYTLTAHVHKRWRKRMLDYNPPTGEKRVRQIEKIIEAPMTIIREYVGQNTWRVTDYRYEFIVDIDRKMIITVNAYESSIPKKILSKSKRKRRSKLCCSTMDLLEEY